MTEGPRTPPAKKPAARRGKAAEGSTKVTCSLFICTAVHGPQRCNIGDDDGCFAACLLFTYDPLSDGFQVGCIWHPQSQYDTTFTSSITPNGVVHSRPSARRPPSGAERLLLRRSSRFATAVPALPIIGRQRLQAAVFDCSVRQRAVRLCRNLAFFKCSSLSQLICMRGTVCMC